jgi:hypothetical protein
MTSPALLAALDTATLALAVLDAEAKDTGPGDRPGGAEPNTFHLPAGTAIRKTLVRFLRRQAARVLGKVRRDPLAVTPADLSVTDWTDAMTSAMTPVLRPIWDAGGKTLYGEVGLDPKSWEVVSPELAPLIEKQSFWLSSETNKKTSLDLAAAHQGLRDALKEGLVEEGESLDWLTERVKDVFDGAETWRARRIAATEAARAQNTASLEAARRSGVVSAKRLLLSSDSCQICHKVKASEPAGGWPLDETMYDDGQGHEFYSEAPCPPLHVHCQCSITYVISKEFSGDDEGEAEQE